MSDDHSDGEDPVDTTEDGEIELNLLREVDGEPVTARKSDSDSCLRTGPDPSGSDTDCSS